MKAILNLNVFILLLLLTGATLENNSTENPQSNLHQTLSWAKAVSNHTGWRTNSTSNTLFIKKNSEDIVTRVSTDNHVIVITIEKNSILQGKVLITLNDDGTYRIVDNNRYVK